MNTKYMGNITELETILAFAKLGYNVLIPYGDCERYDYVVDINNNFYKIQCKTSSSDDENASFKFSCRSCNRKGGKIIHRYYDNDEIDFFATSFNDQCYLVPVQECGGGKRLRLSSPKNGQTRGISWARDYELEEVVKNL